MNPKDHSPVTEKDLENCLKKICGAGNIKLGVPKRPTKKQLNQKFKIVKEGKNFQMI